MKKINKFEKDDGFPEIEDGQIEAEVINVFKWIIGVPADLTTLTDGDKLLEYMLNLIEVQTPDVK